MAGELAISTVCVCAGRMFSLRLLCSRFFLTFAGSPLTLFLLVQKTIFLFALLFCLLYLFQMGWRVVLTSSHELFLLLSPLCSLFAPRLLCPCLRMKLWGRSGWPLQVALLVALVMLCIDPVSAGSRNHRGPTGTPGLALNPSSNTMRG